MTYKMHLSGREIEQLEKAVWKLTGPSRPKVDLFGDDATLPPLEAREVASLRRKLATLLRGGYPLDHLDPYWLERAKIRDVAAWERAGFPTRVGQATARAQS